MCALSGLTLTSKPPTTCCPLWKLWGAAGVARAFQYPTGHQDYIHMRLSHRGLQGIPRIISLVLQGWGTPGSWGRKQGSQAVVVATVMSPSWIPVCHSEINSTRQANNYKTSDVSNARLKSTVWDMASTILFHVCVWLKTIPCCLSPFVFSAFLTTAPFTDPAVQGAEGKCSFVLPTQKRGSLSFWSSL